MSLKLPLCMYSKTMHLGSEQNPEVGIRCGCLTLLRNSTYTWIFNFHSEMTELMLKVVAIIRQKFLLITQEPNSCILVNNVLCVDK